MELTVEQLQHENSEAAGDLAAARAEVCLSHSQEYMLIYHESAILNELLKKKGGHNLVLRDVISVLQKYVRDLSKEYNLARINYARDEAKFQNEIDTSRMVIEKLKKEVERLISVRDDLGKEVVELKKQLKELEV